MASLASLIRGRGVRDLSTLLLGSFAGIPFSLLATAIITRSFSTEEVGLFFLVAATIAALGGFALPGVSAAVVTNAARGERGTIKTAFRWECLGGAVAGAALLICAEWFPALLPLDLTTALLLACLMPLHFNDIGIQALTGQRAYGEVATFRFLLKFLNLIGVAIVVYLGAGIESLIFSFILIPTLIYGIAYQRALGRLNENLTDFRALRYGLHLTLSTLFTIPLAQAERFIIAIFFSLRDLALFGIGELIFGYLKLILMHAPSMYLPRIASLGAREAWRYLSKQLALWMLFGVAACALIGLALPWVFPLVFGDTYQESAFYALLYLPVFIFGIPNVFLSTYLRHQGSVRKTYLFNVVRLPLQLSFLLFGVWYFSIVGVPLARLCANVCQGCFGAWLCRFDLRSAQP